VPAMLKAPLQYSVAAMLALAVYGVSWLGDMLSSAAGMAILQTHNHQVFFASIAFKMVWGVLDVYLLTVTMRILGLFYNSCKNQLGWYNF